MSWYGATSFLHHSAYGHWAPLSGLCRICYATKASPELGERVIKQTIELSMTSDTMDIVKVADLQRALLLCYSRTGVSKRCL